MVVRFANINNNTNNNKKVNKRIIQIELTLNSKFKLKIIWIHRIKNFLKPAESQTITKNHEF